MLLILEILIYGYALWLGLYLIARDVETRLLRYAGLGLLVYALMLASDILHESSDETTFFMRVGWPLPLWLSACWFLAILELLPENHSLRLRMTAPMRLLFLGAMGILYGISAVTALIFDYPNESPQVGYAIFVVVVAIPLAISLLTVIRSQTHALKFIGLATFFVVVGLAGLLLALDILPRSIFLLAISFDLVMFGVAIAFWDASQQGEKLWLDMLRSFDAAFFIALLFGGQVALVMLLNEEVTLPLMTLLLGIIAAAIFVQVWSDPIQNFFDRFAFASTPALQQSREELRNTARALPRLDDSVDFSRVQEAEFAKLTRRALSNMGSLPRLATSPLTQLPIIEHRIAQRGASPDTLERATELKLLLTESIERLKPRGKDAFGITDEWRYYNAVYYPYVMGIKPYSRHSDSNGKAAHLTPILTWFQAQVPERTLYNWQNAAAQLIAQDLRERIS